MSTREWLVFVDGTYAPGEGQTVTAETAAEALAVAMRTCVEPDVPSERVTVYPRMVEAPESHGAS